MAIMVLFLFASAVYGEKRVRFEEAIRQAGSHIIEKLPMNSIVAIDIISEIPELSSDKIISQLSEVLAGSKHLDVSNRDPEDLELLRKERDYQLTNASEETAVRLAKELAPLFLITGKFTQENNGKYYLTIKATNIETNVKPLEKSIEVFDRNIIKNYLFYFGVKTGISLGIYENGYGFYDISTSQTIKNPYTGFDASIFGLISIGKIFAIQTEVMVTNDSVNILSGNTNLVTAKYKSLVFPFLAKLVFWPSVFIVQPFIGAYLSLPLGKMKVMHSNGVYYADYRVMGGFMAGAGFGVKLGPGSIITDMRYARDFRYIKADYIGTRDVSLRNNLNITLGYEIGVKPKKNKVRS